MQNAKRISPRPSDGFLKKLDPGTVATPTSDASQRANATNAIRKVHDFLTVGAPAPLQAAAAVGMAFDADYYNHLMMDYRARRDLLCGALVEAGFTLSPPEGAYYVLTGFQELSEKDDVSFARWLASDVGVATVPGSSFFKHPADGSRLIRFAFCKRKETLEAAVERLASLRATV